MQQNESAQRPPKDKSTARDVPMGVHIPGFSVVVRNSTIEERYPGGSNAFERKMPKQDTLFGRDPDEGEFHGV
jgi:hypothetical protein